MPEPVLQLAHSPDPDDLFMWWPLGTRDVEPDIDTEGLRFAPFPEDIQALNRRAIEKHDLDVTAISIHAYPHVKDHYRLSACAGSFGEGYGPLLVGRAGEEDDRRLLARICDGDAAVAIPGEHTTAFLVLRLMLNADIRFVRMPFSEVPLAVAEGRVSAGLLIHDAQLTYLQLGLRALVDLGRWWTGETGLPLPLGGNVVRRDLDARLGPGASARIGRVLARAIAFAIEHWEEGLRRIVPMAGGLDRATLERYLRMYVNERTVDAGREGRRAIELLLARASAAGLAPPPGSVDLLPGLTGTAGAEPGPR